MCISFAKQCGEGLVKPFRLESAPARCKSSSKLGSYLLTRSLNPFGLESAFARCKSSSKLGSYLLTRSLHRYYSLVNYFLQNVSLFRSFSTKWHVNNVYY